LRNQKQGRIIGAKSIAVSSDHKGDVMKQMKDLPRLETRTVALLTGLAIGLAIVVHDIFFVVAALIVLATPIESAVHWIYEHVTHKTLEHQHS
jgi:hypothetical protein